MLLAAMCYALMRCMLRSHSPPPAGPALLLLLLLLLPPPPLHRWTWLPVPMMAPLLLPASQSARWRTAQRRRSRWWWLQPLCPHPLPLPALLAAVAVLARADAPLAA